MHRSVPGRIESNPGNPIGIIGAGQKYYKNNQENNTNNSVNPNNNSDNDDDSYNVANGVEGRGGGAIVSDDNGVDSGEGRDNNNDNGQRH